MKKRFILDMTMLFVFLIVVGTSRLEITGMRLWALCFCSGLFAQLLEQAVVQVFE